MTLREEFPSTHTHTLQRIECSTLAPIPTHTQFATGYLNKRRGLDSNDQSQPTPACDVSSVIQSRDVVRLDGHGVSVARVGVGDRGGDLDRYGRETGRGNGWQSKCLAEEAAAIKGKTDEAAMFERGGGNSSSAKNRSLSSFWRWS